MPNRLAQSSSPYLLQHKDNPVDWYPWGDEAFAKAKKEDKPIFLSVGYSACHWCHVMEHESFENEAIAKILNEHFVSIKVDREERPDVDQIYMQAVQMMTGSGGWPMSVFMSADGKPFYGGTYFPPDDRFGRPGFPKVLLAINDAWKTKRADILQQGEKINEHLQEACDGPDSVGSLDPTWIATSEHWLVTNYDREHGGYGNAPKFPHATDLDLLIEGAALKATPEVEQAIRTTLDKMSRGGIYDHLGGGFARYSVDREWLVPHFEKMLYDNSLLAVAYADAYRLLGEETYATVVRETLDYIIFQMTNDRGGFYSTEDADSEGVEGKFYVWNVEEIIDVLGGERGQRFCNIYDVTSKGNFEGHNILNLKKSLADFATELAIPEAKLLVELGEDRKKLFERRAGRVRPGLDDKVILSWNALMITAMTRGYRAVGDPRYLVAAQNAVEFIQTDMLQENGRLWHTWREGKPSIDAYLDDYGYLIDAVCELFQVDPQVKYLKFAISLSDVLIEHFSDARGGFFFTADDSETLIARSKDLSDNSVPSGNAMAAYGLLTLSRLTGRNKYREAAESALVAASGVMASSPQAAGQSLRVLRRLSSPSEEAILVLGESPADAALMRSELLRGLRPLGVQICVEGASVDTEFSELCPLLAGREYAKTAALYLCKDNVCQLPIEGDAVLSQLKDQ